MAKRPTRLPMPIKPTRPTAAALSMPASRAAADTCAKGTNIVGAASTVAAYSHQKERWRSVSRSVRPGGALTAARAAPAPAEALAPASGAEATGARCINHAQPTPSTSTPSAISRVASRQGRAAMRAEATSGTTSVPAPIPALAIPEARPRRRVNQGCTPPMAGV